MNKLFPILEWLPGYKRSYLSGDLSAGLTVGVMLIPQGMAYAMLAGLPPVYGLYAAMIPQVIYAFFGTSRQLAVGPVAMDSLLVAAGVSSFAVAGSENYIALAILLSFMMGVVQVGFGVFRLGFLVNFLSTPVISGFTSAAALIIATTQLKHLLGIDLPGSEFVFVTIYKMFFLFAEFNWYTIGVGVLAILLIRFSKKLHRAVPGALVAVVFGVLLVIGFDLKHYGVKILGVIPQGMPSFDIPDFRNQNFKDLIPMAFTLALIAFMEAISVAKALQSKHKGEYELDNNQEMIGLGMGNIVGSFFSAYPTTGGFGRSAVNDQSGAKTNLAALISAVLVGFTLLFLTPLFYYLPNTVLAAIILVAVFGLIDIEYPKILWKTSKQDFLMLLVAFIVTLVFGIKEGIGAGVLVSLGVLVYRTANPHIAVLGKLPNTTDYRNVNRFEEIEVRDDVLIIRHDAQLYFANINNFIDRIKLEVHKKGGQLQLIVFHCGSVSNIDATAQLAIKELIQELNSNQIGVYFSGLIGPVRDYLHKTWFIQEIGENHFFTDVESAIKYLDKGAKKRSKQQLIRALQTNVFKEREV